MIEVKFRYGVVSSDMTDTFSESAYIINFGTPGRDSNTNQAQFKFDECPSRKSPIFNLIDKLHT